MKRVATIEYKDKVYGITIKASVRIKRYSLSQGEAAVLMADLKDRIIFALRELRFVKPPISAIRVAK